MKHSSWLLPLLLLLLCSCQEPEEEVAPSATPTSVIKVEGPDTGKAGEPLLLDVYFVVANGCGQFGSFGTTGLGSDILIAVYPVYNGEVCTQNLPTRKAVYTFTPSAKGTYPLKFWQGTNNYLLKTITVE